MYVTDEDSECLGFRNSLRSRVLQKRALFLWLLYLYKWGHSIIGKTSPLQGEVRGSIPRDSTIIARVAQLARAADL